MRFQIPEDVRLIVAALQNSGYRAVLVGGCVRDMWMGRKPKDFDVATSALPDQVTKLFTEGGLDARVEPTGLQHGTVTVIRNGVGYEVTTFRTDGKYSDGRRPDDVKLGVTLEEDLSRRDFTMNAMAWDPVSDEFIDPFEGRKHINAEFIHCVGDSQERFNEDGLRVARAFRFAGQLGFFVSNDVTSAARACKHLLEKTSVERRATEFVKLLCGDYVHHALCEVMDVPGLLQFWLGADPIPGGLNGVSLTSVPGNAEARLTMYFRDAPPASVLALLRDLKLSRDICKRVPTLVEFINQALELPEAPPPAVVRHFAAQMAEEGVSVDDLLRFKEVLPMDVNRALADCKRERWPVTLSALDIKGRDIVEIYGRPGPHVGRAMDLLMHAVLADPTLNTHSTLKELARVQSRANR